MSEVGVGYLIFPAVFNNSPPPPPPPGSKAPPGTPPSGHNGCTPVDCGIVPIRQECRNYCELIANFPPLQMDTDK